MMGGHAVQGVRCVSPLRPELPTAPWVGRRLGARPGAMPTARPEEPSGADARSPGTRCGRRPIRRCARLERGPAASQNARRRPSARALTERRSEAASPRAIYAHLVLDGVSEGIAVRVLAHEARVDDVRGLCGESRDAARRADRCSPDVGVIALAHARHHRRRSARTGRSASHASQFLFKSRRPHVHRAVAPPRGRLEQPDAQWSSLCGRGACAPGGLRSGDPSVASP